MHSLAELQAHFARALIAGADEPIGALVGGAEPRKRLEIHRRHCAASLVAALRDKFPACAWLAGDAHMDATARAYLRAHPPQQPCIAEYGADFPSFLATHVRAGELPYLESFAALEWAVGRVSIAVDRAPVSWSQIAEVGSERLIDSTLVLQPGLQYLCAAWRVDELMTTYLSGAEPERFVLAESDTFIEVQGARGAVRLAQLDGATFIFRAALAAGRSIGAAAGRALERDPTFDSGAALRLLVQAGLVAAINVSPEGHAS